MKDATTSSPTSLQEIEQAFENQHPFWTLVQLYRRDLGKFGLSMGFYILKHSPEWIRPIAIANIVDIISNPSRHTVTALWINGAVLAIAIAQNIPTHYLHVRFMSVAKRNMERNLRLAIAQRLQCLSIGYFRQQSSGALQAKLLSDVDAIGTLTSHLFQYLPATFLTIAVAIAVTAVRAPWFLLFFVGTVPAAAIIVRSFKKPIRDRNHRFRQQIEALSARLVDMVKLVPVTRAHGAESTEIAKIEQRLQTVNQAGLRLDSINALTNATAWVTLRLFYCLCLLSSAWFAYSGQFEISAGDVVLLVGYFDSLTGGMVQMMTVFPQLGKGFESVRSVGEIFAAPDLEFNLGKPPVKSVRGEFIFENVSFTYPGFSGNAIKDFSLHVSPGETIAIVGPSGAGKSTLLNLTIGFLRPTQGQILLDGRDMNGLDLRTYRQFLSVVSQETILFSGTVRENILYGRESVSEEQLRQAIIDANAHEFISELPQGLATRIGEDGMKLSGGQRQRIAIARALIRNPRVLVLDEATASLDTASERLIQQALERLLSNRTTFVVAHRLSTIRQADRIVVLAKGQITELGNHHQLLSTQGLYAHLHALQH